MPDIPLDLFRRIADRANDPLRRTFMTGAQASATPLDLGSLMTSLQKHGAPGAQGLAGAAGSLNKLMGSLGGSALMMGPGGVSSLNGTAAASEALPPPPSDEAVASAEQQLGRPIPAEVRQLYKIGDGGFGPGDGLFSLARLVKRYGTMTGEPFGPKGQDWPANLLPLFDENPVLICIDTDSGRIVAWDPGEIEDEDSDADWERSFKPEAPDLAALMQHWVDSPAFGEGRG